MSHSHVSSSDERDVGEDEGATQEVEKESGSEEQQLQGEELEEEEEEEEELAEEEVAEEGGEQRQSAPCQMES